MTRRDFLPICLNLKKCNILIVGGGNVAYQKLRTLLRFRVKVAVMTIKASPLISRLAQRKKIALILRAFKPLDLAGYDLVYACTDNHVVNQKIAKAAKAQSVLCNITDYPEISDFISPAVIKKNNLTVAVSTSGKDPAFAVSLRNRIKEQWEKII